MDTVKDTLDTNTGADESADLVYWIWLSLAIGAGSSAAGKLFDRLGKNVKTIYDADPSEYAGLPEETVQHLSNKSLRASIGIYNWCVDNGVGMLPYNSAYFPKRLRDIPSPPVMLYYLGLLPNINNRLAVAVVGTRRISQYGARNAYTISGDLASAGAAVVSGMALGVDGVVHRAVLDADGYTIAVLGCGIDRIYPAEHKNLHGEIIRRGTVITEFCPGSAPISHNFPIRNRIISGICEATVVIEAGEKSGALITARTARRQGRTVYALPGNVGAFGSAGTNKLLLEGAKIATSALDILDDYKNEYAKVLNIDNVTGKLARFDRGFNLHNTYGVKTEPCYPRLGVNGESRGTSRKRRTGDGKMPKRYRQEIDDGVRVDNLTAPEKESVDASEADLYATAPETGVSLKSEESMMPSPETLLLGASDCGKKIYSLIPENGTVTVDELVRHELSFPYVMAGLTELEISGLAVLCPGGEYRRGDGSR